MRLNDYQNQALQTIHVPRHSLLPSLTVDEQVLMSALGLAGEAGEVADLVKKLHFAPHRVPGDFHERLVEELGDCLWYMAVLASRNALTLEEIAQRNIEKLSRRYPNGRA